MTTTAFGHGPGKGPGNGPGLGPGLGPGAGDLLRTTLRDHLGTESPRLVVLAMSRDENPKATILAFGPGQRTPRLVVKVAMTAGAVAAVRAEATALHAVAALDPGLVGGTVPRLVDVRLGGSDAVLVTEALAGVPMSVDYHRWRHTARPEVVRRDVESAVGWLRELGRVAAPGDAFMDASSDASLDAPSDAPEAVGGARQALAAAEPADPGAPAVPALLRRRWPRDEAALGVAGVLSDLEPVLRLPEGEQCAVVHGDFWCGNVLRSGGHVTGVVDWEHAQVGGDPLRDLARFVLSYSLYLDRHTRPGRPVEGHPGLVAGPWGEPLRYVARGDGWFPALVAEVVAHGLGATGRDPGRWREVLGAGTAEIAALSDHAEFAHQHLLLAAELLRCR
jgi:aminoglycoside phosphotransferase